MMREVNCCVIYLKRIAMDDIVLDPDLKPGEWKEIFEVEKLRQGPAWACG